MNVTYQDQAKQSERDHALLQQATKQLEEVIRASTEDVSAEWERGQDERGATVYTLTLSDSSERAAGVFTPAQLASSGQLRGCFLGLWGDLLQARSQAQLEKIRRLLSQGD